MECNNKKRQLLPSPEMALPPFFPFHDFDISLIFDIIKNKSAFSIIKNVQNQTLKIIEVHLDEMYVVTTCVCAVITAEHICNRKMYEKHFVPNYCH